jgi:NAD(P)H-dependent FMN reductase
MPLMSSNPQPSPLNVLLVVGNRSRESTTRAVVMHAGSLLEKLGCQVVSFDYATEDLPLFDVQTAFSGECYTSLKQRVMEADVILLGTPDYHGSMSSALKNFLDHFWKEFAGKLFASVVGSHEKGLTVHDQIRTVLRQCYAWGLPYGVSFSDRADLNEGQITSGDLLGRLDGLAHDLVTYGSLLAAQRQKDLAGDTPGFLAHYRR